MTDATTGDPIEGAELTAVPDIPDTATAADGTYAVADIPIGAYVLTVSADDYSSVEKVVGVAAGLDVTYDFQLTPGEEHEIIEPLVRVRSVKIAAGDDIQYEADLGRAAGTVAITTAAGHDQEKIRTSGVRSVPVNDYIFLRGASEDHAGTAITDWAWEWHSKPVVSAATFTNSPAPEGGGAVSSQEVYVLTDVPGEYVARLTVTLEGGGTEEEDFVFWAGNYVGTANCQGCHNGSAMPDKYTPYYNTGHATKFEVQYGSYSAGRGYCLRCHTVGYDEAADNDGFDERAEELGWDPAVDGEFAGYMKNLWPTIADFLGDPATMPMQERMNIGCENCHGPGQSHTRSYTHDVGVCGQCHPQPAQWAESGHVGWTMGDHNSTGESCVACHTSEGYAAAASGKEVEIVPGMHSLGCAGCHDPHAITPGAEEWADQKPQLRRFGDVTLPNGEVAEAHLAATCYSCHNGRRGDPHEQITHSSHWGPHRGTQGSMFEATGGYEVEGESYASSFHGGSGFHPTGEANEKCLTCHMYSYSVARTSCTTDADCTPGWTCTGSTPLCNCVSDDQCGPAQVCSHGHCDDHYIGGHTWKMSWLDVDGTHGGPPGTEYQNINSCMQDGCHSAGSITDFNRGAAGDYDGDGTTEGIQDEIAGLIEVVSAEIPVDADGEWDVPLDDPPTDEQLALRGAAYNVEFVELDGSGGVHNTRYAVQLLQKSYEDVTGNPVPGADIP